MRLLIVDPRRSIRAAWTSRLGSHELELHEAADESEVRDVLDCNLMAAVMVPFPFDWCSEPSEFLRSIHEVCHHTIALTDGSKQQNDAAFALGVSECLSSHCGNDDLNALIERIRYVSDLEDRVVQAQKMEAVGELAAGIAHEINTPIQYVGDNTRFVRDACEDLMDVLTKCSNIVGDEQPSRDVAAIKTVIHDAMIQADFEYLIDEVPAAIRQTLEGVERVANIVRAMKEFAHPGVSEMVPTDLSKCIENTAMVARNEWKYVANLETTFDSELPPVPCLPGELNQVLLNLIVNAAHAIADRQGDTASEKGRIGISTHRCGTAAEIRVADTGTGIDAANVEKIFKPFFTTKAAGKGTGQGLAIAHSVIVEKHGGTIDVESKLGAGTTFVIRLPLGSTTEQGNQPVEAIEKACVG
ncbi:sensor histidine kinase [Crateriforma conspicua]|uniref:histidine kinase n=1 Tax=Crateriforma conspicua TaxID=2527996 RepID=A0A5C6FLP0_9PLAN|nr:ATP-binding protein [Crateriforma conspicua]TWU62042.1 Sensor protein ZraS [Crateriforma conspicua]